VFHEEQKGGLEIKHHLDVVYKLLLSSIKFDVNESLKFVIFLSHKKVDQNFSLLLNGGGCQNG
jgi:hypothetical protein